MIRICIAFINGVSEKLTEIPIEISALPATHSERLIETLRALMQEQNLNETQLARAINTPQPTIHRILSGQVTDPRISTLNTIAKYFGISLDQLLGNAPIQNNETIQRVIPIPVIPWEEAPKANRFTNTLTPQNWTQWTTIDISASPTSYALISRTNMSPRFPAGSLLIVDPETKPIHGDTVIVYFKTFKNITLRELMIDGHLKQLHSILSNTPPEPITNKHNILGVVIQTRFSYRA